MPFAASQIKTAQSYAARRGFPQLNGTPAQIEWAEQIRMRLVKGLDASIRAGQGHQRTLHFQETKNWMLEHTDASWWIEQRHRRPGNVSQLRNAQAISIYCELLGKKQPRRAEFVTSDPSEEKRSSRK